MPSPEKSRNTSRKCIWRTSKRRERSYALADEGVRCSTIIFIPYFGRSVIKGSGATECPGTSRNFHFCASVAKSNTPSIQANDSPIHCRTPAPKGKYVSLVRRERASGEKRSGSKRNGSGKKR